MVSMATLSSLWNKDLKKVWGKLSCGCPCVWPTLSRAVAWNACPKEGHRYGDPEGTFQERLQQALHDRSLPGWLF